jgi:hypothetical protein
MIKNVYKILVAVIIVSAFIATPIAWYFTRPTTPPSELLSCRGLVVDNATKPLFNVTVILYTDATYMHKGFTNKFGRFEVFTPLPSDHSIPVTCFAFKQGYAETVQNVILTNLTKVDTRSDAIIWGYADFNITMTV